MSMSVCLSGKHVELSVRGRLTLSRHYRERVKADSKKLGIDGNFDIEG